ncbi:hypothetical protein ACFSZT_22380 [Prauserella oleivorans]
MAEPAKPGGWLSDVTFWIDGTASTAGAAGSGFSLSREEAEVALRENL